MNEENRITVENFLALLNGISVSSGVTVTDKGGLVLRVLNGRPNLTVSQDFLQNLGEHAIVLSLESPATNDVIARLGQVDNAVVSFSFDGIDYYPKVSSVVAVKQPMHIQQMLRRKCLSQDEFHVVKEYLLSKEIKFEVVDEAPEPEAKIDDPEIATMYADENAETQNVPDEIRKLVKAAEPKRKPVAETTDSDDELPTRRPVKKDEEPPRKTPKPAVKVDDEPPRKTVPPKRVVHDDESEDLSKRPPTTIHIPSDDEASDPPAKTKEEPKDEETSKSVSVVFFKKKKDGTKDKTVCKMDGYVFKIVSKNGKNELICMGKYDAKIRDSVDLTSADLKDARAKKYVLDPKYNGKK